MSSNMAVATKERPTSMRWTQMDFWDGMEHAFMMPSITAEGTGVHSHRSDVWWPRAAGLRGRDSALQPSRGGQHLGLGLVRTLCVGHRSTAQGVLEG